MCHQLLYCWPSIGRPGRAGRISSVSPSNEHRDSPATSWLPNRIGFDGPVQNQPDIPTNVAPIQKFYWWDARIDDKDRGATFAYRITPVAGSPTSLKLLDDQAATIQVTVPQTEQNGIGSYFNRAVVSSQAFGKQFPKLDTDDQRRAAEAWLANGL